MKLKRIQKRNILNDVCVADDSGFGGANHHYLVSRLFGCDREHIAEIVFQNGPRNEVGSTKGVLDVDLLEIVRHRLRSFQAGEFSCRENAIALTHIEDALLWLNKRVEDRVEAGVLGRNEVAKDE